MNCQYSYYEIAKLAPPPPPSPTPPPQKKEKKTDGYFEHLFIKKYLK